MHVAVVVVTPGLPHVAAHAVGAVRSQRYVTQGGPWHGVDTSAQLPQASCASAVRRMPAERRFVVDISEHLSFLVDISANAF